MSEETKKRSSLLTWPAAIAAYLFGRFFGWDFLWPMFGALATAFVGSRFIRPKFRAMLPAISLQGAELFWLLVALTVMLGGFLSTKDMSQNLRDYNVYGLVVDAVIQTVFIAWVALRPTIPAVVSISLYQVLDLAVGTYDFMKPYITFEDEKAIAIHSILHISIIVMLFVGLHEVRREAQTPEADFAKPAV